MIVITGASGLLGSQILNRLLARIPPEQLAVSVRDTQKAQHLAARGVRVRRGDFSDPDSLVDAFQGASQLLLVSSNDSGADAVTQHRTAIDAGRAAGATRVLYTSHQGSSASSMFPPMLDHAATERHLAEQGGDFTSLRHGFYASTLPMLIGRALETGTILAPADGPVSWTTHGDLAEVDAIVLADEGRLEGVSPPLTGTETFDLEEVGGILSDLTGRRISRVVVDDEEWIAGMVARGIPETQARFALTIFLSARRGEFDVTDTTLSEVLGRPATSVRTYLKGMIAGG